MKKIRLRLKSFDKDLLDSSVKNIVINAKRNGAHIVGPVRLPTRISKYIVNRSPHGHKKSREQFGMKHCKVLIDLSSLNPHLLHTFTHLQLPAGVDINVEVVA